MYKFREEEIFSEVLEMSLELNFLSLLIHMLLQISLILVLSCLFQEQLHKSIPTDLYLLSLHWRLSISSAKHGQWWRWLGWCWHQNLQKRKCCDLTCGDLHQVKALELPLVLQVRERDSWEIKQVQDSKGIVEVPSDQPLTWGYYCPMALFQLRVRQGQLP